MYEFYFIDNVLQFHQQYSLDRGHVKRSHIDLRDACQRQADSTLSEEIAAEARAKRPEWRAHFLLALPWREMEPMGDTLRYRRDANAYEVPLYERVLKVPPLAMLAPTEAHPPLTLRPLRHVVEPRTLAGAVHEGTLYIVESWP